MEKNQQSDKGREQEKTIQVHFRLAESIEAAGDLESKLCSVEHSVAIFKADFAKQWNQEMDKISISFQGENLSNATTLSELGIGSDNTVTLVVHPAVAPPILSPSATPLSDMKSHNILTTEVKIGNSTKEVFVKIERLKLKKAFLGGYRHVVSGVEYHHAAIQTRPKPLHNKGVEFNERDCQTVETRNKPQQVATDAATQMNKNGCFINSNLEKEIVITGVYETADDYLQRILDKVIILQSHWRRWLATCFVEGLRRDKQRREEWERAELARRQREREEHARKEFHRRMNPRTREDFDLLYHALEMWRQEEMAHINETCGGAERKAALCSLLEQEAQLIASIGRHKVVADEENKDSEAVRFLNKTAAPKRWTAFDGKVTEMNGPYTLRAEELRDIYSTLVMLGLSQDERLDVLLTVKSTVKEHDCKLTRDIVELVDREADLLVRGIGNESLRGLRKRISSLFMQYCKTPLFNPEAAKHIKVPQDVSTLSTNVYYCRSCSQYLPSTDFELSVTSRYMGHCRACRDLDNQARAREDWSTYRLMLKSLRHSEERHHDNSHIIFLLQEADLRYLVESIWGAESALSACKDLYELRMIRWQPTQPWTPWNCLLVTSDEATSHAKLDNMEAAYGAPFVQKVQHRHILARNYFTHIPGMAQELKGKVRELPLPQSRQKEFTVIMNPVVNPEHVPD